MTLLTTAFSQGTHAARPAAASSNNGFYYYETDTTNLFQSTGSAWQQIASTGGASPLTTKGDLFGHSTVDARIPVGADNTVLTADSAQTLGVKWATVSGSGGLVKLFDSTLGVAATSIDTGAGGIAAGHGDLICYVLARTVTAAVADSMVWTVNNDTSSIYDAQNISGTGSAVGAGPSNATAGWAPLCAHGASGGAGYAGVSVIAIPSYDQTTFWKTASATISIPDTGTGGWALLYSLGYRSTAAISRLKVAGGSGGATNLAAGSRLVVYGTQ
jgi:hypothetical protein